MGADLASLKDLPDWPRLLSRVQSAAYVGVSPGTFDKEVGAGYWPPGERRGGRITWDRVLLDQYQDARSGLAAPGSEGPNGWDEDYGGARPARQSLDAQRQAAEKRMDDLRRGRRGARERFKSPE